jgi:hypothetical protein
MSRSASGRPWAGTSLSEQVSEGRRFLELARAIASDDAPAGLWVELLASVCFLATEELDFEAAIEAGDRALALAAAAPPSPVAAEARALLSLPLAQSGKARSGLRSSLRRQETPPRLLEITGQPRWPA